MYLVYLFGIMVGQVIVYCYNVNVMISEGVEIVWKSGNKCFVFVSFYFGDLIFMQYYVVNQLDIEMMYVQYLFVGFMNNSEGFRQDFIEDWLLVCQIVGIG